MDQGTVGRIEDWEARPFSGGVDGLRELAGADFSGAISASGAWMFMLNGRIVGVIGGSLDGFEAAAGTAYESPHPSLPLLFAMREQGGETRAKYYTDNTPLNEVDRTLSEGGFTGYVELSENVLSGDYYLVYYGGQSLSAAFIGSEERLVTGDEAFERASNEVGIYEVRTVDLDVRDVPEAASTPARPEPTPDPEPDADTEPPGTVDEEGTEAETSTSATSSDTDTSATGSSPSEPSSETPSESPAESGDRADEANRPTSQRPSAEPDRARAEPVEESRTDAAAGSAGTDPTQNDRPSDAESVQPSDAAETPEPTADPPEEDPFSEEEEWREARTIPSLDPEESDAVPRRDASQETADRPTQSPSPAEQSERARSPTADRVEELRSAIESYEERITGLEGRLEETTAERDRLREERDRLQRRVRELEAAADTTDEGEAPAEALDPTEALAKTDVFVRYGSKGKATLESALVGDADRDDVFENLRLETHTRFDDGSITVDGRSFDDYLDDTLEHRFVRWVVEDLLYEIRDTANEGGLRELFDAIPRVDRIEFQGAVTSRDEDGEERRDAFDVILRDRMGSPLVVADLNDARDPASDDTLSDLIERATTVADAQESLAAAFMVTASFFEPAALESASEATGAGFLNRDARKSFVKLTRKQGYHLCLVEARGDEFHVAVPEL